MNDLHDLALATFFAPFPFWASFAVAIGGASIVAAAFRGFDRTMLTRMSIGLNVEKL
jgi:hypothetical protein